MHRLLARLAAATLAVAAAGLVVPSSPAAAAFCGAEGGVSTVVDPGALGGAVSKECGPGPAAGDAFADDHDLQEHPRQPGFICRIDGAPADGDCLRNDAYWALFVSNDGGPWVYASAGAYGQSVDDGDAVAFVWQSTGSRRSPGVAPPAAPAATPTPTKPPSAKPTKKPGSKPSRTPSAKPSAPAAADPSQPTTAPPSPTATPTAGASRSPSPSTSASPSATGSPSTSPSTSPSGTASSGTPAASPTDEVDAEVSSASAETAADGGVPLWLVLVMLVLVLGATVAVLVHRRRAARSPGP